MNLGKTIRIFIDTEFTDFINTDLISIGLVADNGTEFYSENADYLKPWASTWVKEHVIPLCKGPQMSRNELSARVWEWISDLPAEFVIISIDYKTDWDLLNDLFGEDKHPKIIEVQNIFNNMYYSIDEQTKAIGGSDSDYQNTVARCKAKFNLYFMDYFFRTKEIQHHALSDAKANREAYSQLVLEFGIPK